MVVWLVNIKPTGRADKNMYRTDRPIRISPSPRAFVRFDCVFVFDTSTDVVGLEC